MKDIIVEQSNETSQNLSEVEEKQVFSLDDVVPESARSAMLFDRNDCDCQEEC